MKITPSLSRYLQRLNLPVGILIALLQRTPVLRMAVATEEFVLSSPLGAVLKSALATAASLGAVHSLAGATELSPSKSSPASATVGTAFTVAFDITGTISAADWWTVSGPVPPGLTFNGGATAGRVNTNEAPLVLSGTPTAPGTYTFTLVAGDSIGGESGMFSYTVNVSGGAVSPPSFTTQPQSQTVTAGANVTFTAAASGSPTYQWKKDGNNLSGATLASLALSNVQASDAGVYTVVATNSGGSTTSSSATLTVNAVVAAPSFTTQPQTQAVTEGENVTFTAAASGSPTYQWKKNGSNVSGATSASLALTNVQAADAGVYTVVATNSGGSTTSSAATLTVNAPVVAAPAITLDPVGFTLGTGMTGVLTAAASGSPAPTYQWKKDGANVASGTNSSLTVTTAGSYTVVAANASGSATSAAAVVALDSTENVGRLLNLSIRTAAGSGAQTLIAGFVVGGGAGGATKPLLVRAVGPTLATYGVTGVLNDPQMSIVPQGGSAIASNDNWGGDAEIVAVASTVGAFDLSSSTSKDAAVYLQPNAGVYTAVVTGVGGGTGVALAEVYDASDANFTSETPRLTNVSARTQVGTGDKILIAGFVIGGQTARTVLVRGVGPTLATYGVTGTLSDPKLALFVSGGSKLAENDDWSGDATVKAVGDTVGAFSLASDSSKDAVLLITLPPGVYTAQVSGVNNTTGVALVEVYEVP